MSKEEFVGLLCEILKGSMIITIFFAVLELLLYNGKEKVDMHYVLTEEKSQLFSLTFGEMATTISKTEILEGLSNRT